MKTNFKIGQDVYIEDENKHRYFGKVKTISKDKIGVSFGTDEIIEINLTELKIF